MKDIVDQDPLSTTNTTNGENVLNFDGRVAIITGAARGICSISIDGVDE